MTHDITINTANLSNDLTAEFDISGISNPEIAITKTSNFGNAIVNVEIAFTATPSADDWCQIKDMAFSPDATVRKLFVDRALRVRFEVTGLTDQTDIKLLIR